MPSLNDFVRRNEKGKEENCLCSEDFPREGLIKVERKGARSGTGALCQQSA